MTTRRIQRDRQIQWSSLTPMRAERLERAVECLRSRMARETRPDGAFHEGLWHPSDSERQVCCDEVGPNIMLLHCIRPIHIANRYQVDLGVLLTRARELGVLAYRSQAHPRPNPIYIIDGVIYISRGLSQPARLPGAPPTTQAEVDELFKEFEHILKGEPTND